MTSDSSYVFFYKVNEEYGAFSQWYRSCFTYCGKNFATAEQFMMYQKALLFHDMDMAELILNSPDVHPSQHKMMGRNIQGFDAEVWSRESLRLVAMGNFEKFTQNHAIVDLLLQTRGKTLVEASPYDRVWGIGFSKANATVNINRWGENKLGKALMMVRDAILERHG